MDPSKVASQLARHIKDVILVNWLNGLGTAEVKLEEDPRLTGATEAFHFKVSSVIEFVIKYHLQDVPKEKRGYEILQKPSSEFRKHLIQPLFTEDLNSAILLTPYLVSASLHEIIADNLVDLKWVKDALYPDVLFKLRNFWQKTKANSKLNLKELYYKRIIERTEIVKKEWNIKDIDNFAFILNGEKFGDFKEIKKEMMDRLNKHEKEIKYSCTIHGDEHPKNILIKKNELGLNKDSWVLIDYVNASKNSDWIFSIGKILHWWDVYYAIELNKGKTVELGRFEIDKERKAIIIDYDPKELGKWIPSICRNLSQIVLNFSLEVGRDVFEESEESILERVNLALFTMNFGSVARHLKEDTIFAVPVFLGEGLLNLKKIREN